MKQGLKETPSIEDWLCDVLPVKSFVGVNPFLYSSSMTMLYYLVVISCRACKKVSGSL